MKLGQKLPMAIAGVMLLTAAASMFGIQRLNAALSVYDVDVRSAVDHERSARHVALQFTTQTQEWKNTLLRGKDVARRDQHWAAFKKAAVGVERGTRTLLESMPTGEVRELVSRFGVSEAAMGVAYAKAYALFEAAEFDPVVGDKAVQGIDREAAGLIDEAARQLGAVATATAVSANATARLATQLSIALTLFSAAVGLVVASMLTRNLLRQLGADPTDVAAIVRRVTAGDLATSTGPHSGNADSVVGLLGQMQASLARVVSAVRANSESVAIASAEIAQGNSDLSSRTEQQASALQQTAATMSELGSTVRSNAENANQADQLAQSASDVAAQGGVVVDKVVATMKGINESSQKISDIISVIDGIAFQTNILALNAAVEAARAGEQGRGFAVVASEVRSLAQRSAEAAKQIKGLIGRSVEQVGLGTVLVDQAGKTMVDIVASIGRVSSIVAEISLASAQQSSGVQQVGDAVNQMDEATQRNAALVEESAAAAESLKVQARDLVQAVSLFKLSAVA